MTGLKFDDATSCPIAGGRRQPRACRLRAHRGVHAVAFASDPRTHGGASLLRRAVPSTSQDALAEWEWLFGYRVEVAAVRCPGRGSGTWTQTMREELVLHDPAGE